MPKKFLKKVSGRFPLFMTAKESCDALGVEISRRNRLVQNAKKIPGSLCTAVPADKRNCTPTYKVHNKHKGQAIINVSGSKTRQEN